MRPPVLISSGTDVAAVLRADREALGITGERFDAMVGWADRYTAKAENPEARWGKGLIVVHAMADLWLQALDRHLVLLDRATAERLAQEGAAASETVGHGLERVRVLRMVVG